MIYGQRNNLGYTTQATKNRQLQRAQNLNYASMEMRDMERQYAKTVKEKAQQRARDLQKDAEIRKQRSEKIERRKRLQDLYNRETKKLSGAQPGELRNLNQEYLRNLDRLKYMAEGRRRPLDMQEVFGQPSPFRPFRG